MNQPPYPATGRRPFWPWMVLALGLIWTVAIRVPLVLNAEDHLDSDLAVDGLTLLDATHGHWRWHYPGTPHMGILPVLFSFPQALVLGANPVTLVSGGTAIWVLVVVATFGLAWRAFGPSAAGWSILPLVFSSKGTIWLSGRITGGHLLTLGWHVLALAGLCTCLTRGGWRRAALLGGWCGLGVYLDAMFAISILGIAVAASLEWLVAGRARSGPIVAAAFVGGLMLGMLPREVGRWIDPYDAYPSQFSATLEPSAVLGHAELLVDECLPRLLAGSGLRWTTYSVGPRAGRLSIATTFWPSLAILVAFVAAVAWLAFVGLRSGSPPRRAVAVGSLVSAVAIVGAFLVNRNIYNSDNYRYLIFLLTPWALGFGLGMDSLVRSGRRGRAAAALGVVLLAALMSDSTLRWYQFRRYVDSHGIPVRRPRPPWSEVIVRGDGRRASASTRALAPTGRFTIPPDITHVFGGYWEVYRLSFLSGGRIRGIPNARYPNRFPGWSSGLGPGRGRILILWPAEASSWSSKPAAEVVGERFERLHSARGVAWEPGFTTVWVNDGRDPAELKRLQVVVP
ncbi:MAG: ArnT family glycosyltransferase [Isosphaeraceae bacterium]